METGLAMQVMRGGGDLTAVVRGLLEKYGKPVPESWRVVDAPPPTVPGHGLTLVPGWSLLGTATAEGCVPLLPWRSERRFQELKRLVEGRTIDPVLMCRFSCMTDGRTMDLSAVLYREFDLAEWLTGAPILAVTAAIEADRWANVILRLKNGVVCSVEASTSLPPGTSQLDRHELIARRGVACDGVVDTQVPQSSVYAFTAEGNRQYTDTDAELFGLSPAEVYLVRSAYETLSNLGCLEAVREQHRRLAHLVRLATESDRRRERLAV